ncbi:capsule polysaccharide biosynthesis protein [Dothidotthia symphoricarpi CBS 119687]|uniref:Capsule polysaccharide biosynthesis protein n=1 Tax=Dothidotthia symphoricarpi CBS 119687 TaxID=1392245 RepID=A0A6A6AKF5_9PLEO|nr:capsule polysaccharide biosynthesis protein [Dothidotthia symphoricarpi CBS 119687]KAF2132300.1 capsule polysaccharide biosynthesis protein [Dothidotthia symphoricarpi CBS 119687]
MATSQLAIPEKYKSELRYVEAKDTRTDAEILHSFTEHVPVTSEKNIWTYWHSGVKSMPSWCQRNIINWVRLQGSEWTVRVLDTVPDSPNHALKWIAPEELPEAFVEGTMTGPYVGPHSADFLRGAALYAYGGIWMDVGNILFRHLDKVCWDQLADDNSPYTVSAPWMLKQYIANHFIAARKGDIFIKKWHELFVHLWKGRKDFTGVLQSPLIAFIQDFKFGQAEDRNFKWDFKVDEATALGYIGQCVAWIRLTWLQEPDGGFDGVDYWAKKVLLFDAGQEDWAAEQLLGYKGEDLFKVLTTKRDADAESEEFKKAEETIWRLLTKSSLQKITHGKGLTHSVHCGVLMDLPENEGSDQQPETFAELLRFGSVHFEQTRESVVYVDPIMVDPQLVIRKGFLEA